MNDVEIARVIDTFPKEFGLRAFPGKRFVLNASASYFSAGQLMLYIYTAEGLAFSKGTESELRKELTP